MNPKTLIKYIKNIYYEIRASFVPEKVNYELEGKCCRCGDCCRYMYSLDTYTEKEFKFFTKLYPEYKRFKVIGKDESGHLILACKLIDEYNLCPDYNNRLAMCKDYPNPDKIRAGGKLYGRCTYSLVPEKDFESYLSSEEKLHTKNGASVQVPFFAKIRYFFKSLFAK